jgi:TetR/AcrR family transcriptional regulator, regulator of cefoperazone and chloramphenicol sensitivity
VPTHPRGPNRKGSATRAAILSAATESIAELGLSRTSSHVVVRRSGFTFGVIQHHFGTYNGLLLAVVEAASAGLRNLLSELKPDEGASTRDRVTAVADVVWDYFRRPEYLSYLEIYLHLLRDPDASDATREAIQAFDADVEQVWRSTVQRLFGEALGEAAFQRVLFGAMRGLAVSRWLNDGKPDFANERAIIADMLAKYVDEQAPP